MKTIITGISGMIGGCWAHRASEMGWPVFGIDPAGFQPSLPPALKDSIFTCSILDSGKLMDVLAEIRPDLIIHLAAQSFSSLSWEQEESTHSLNYMGTFKLFQAAREVVPEAKILFASSSAVYGMAAPSDCPLSESRLLRPVTPYAVTKAAGELLAGQFYASRGIKIYVPRFFNLLGPAPHAGTAVQAFARQLALIACQKIEPELHVGNLEAERDYLDIQDAISAMLVLLEKGPPGTPINICSGQSMKISELLRLLIEVSGLKVTIKTDPALIRPIDEPALFGSSEKIRSLGWEPRVPMKESLERVYKWWVGKVQS